MGKKLLLESWWSGFLQSCTEIERSSGKRFWGEKRAR
jgi:hypothetical protein